MVGGLIGGPGRRRLVDPQDHPGDVLADRHGEDAAGVGHEQSLAPGRIGQQVVDAGRADLQPAQLRDAGQVRRRPSADEDLDLGIGQGCGVERPPEDVDDLEPGRERLHAPDGLGADLGVEDQAHRVNDSVRPRRENDGREPASLRAGEAR